MRHDPIALYRHALLYDAPLADALTRAFRRDPVLARRADRLLQSLPRAGRSTRAWTEMRAFHRIAAALDLR